MEALTYRAADWHAASAADYLPAFDGDTALVENLRAAVVDGFAQSYDVLEGAAVVGGFVTRMDGGELEILAAWAGRPGRAVSVEVLPMVEAAAAEAGASAIKINTFRPGLMRQLAALDYRALHVTFWKAVNGQF